MAKEDKNNQDKTFLDDTIKEYSSIVNERKDNVEIIRLQNMSYWIDINIALPLKNMMVEWICTDRCRDVGYFYKDTETFASIDLKSNMEITHWRPAELQPQKNKI